MKKHLSISLRRMKQRSRLNALIIKEFHQIKRDISSVLIGFVLPAILLFLYGYGISLDYKHLKVGLVLEETSNDAIVFATCLTNSPYFAVTIGRHRKEFEQDIIRGKIHGIIVVPSYFSTFKDRPDQIAPIQVITDGSDPNTAHFVENYVAGAFQKYLGFSREGTSLISLEPRYYYNEELESRFFLLPGSLAIIMTLIGTLLTALVISREWERGTMESLMATPVTIIEIILGKLISYFVLGMLSFLFSFFVATLLFQVPFRGSFFLLLIVTSIFLLTALGLGLLISTIAKNQFVASQAALVSAFLPAFILSGFIFEISSMPPFVRFITNFIPAKYFVTSLQTLFLTGNAFPLLPKNMAFMLLLGSIFYLAITKKTVKRLDG